jgi:hypothetical protein
LQPDSTPDTLSRESWAGFFAGLIVSGEEEADYCPTIVK